MSLAKRLTSKKYLTRIYLWFASLILLITSVLSSVVYYNVQKKVFTNEYNNSRKMLIQTKYNIEYLDDMVRNLLLSIYNNNDVKSLMYLNEAENYDEMNVINKLKSTVVWSNSYAHSVYVYNNNKHIYYSTYGDFIHQDMEWNKVIQENGGSVPPLKPIIRNMNVSLDPNRVQLQKVLTYVMYELTDDQGRMDGAVVLNVKLEWLFNNIQAINKIDAKQLNKMFILSNNQNFMEVDPETSLLGEKLETKLIQAYHKLPASDTYFTVKLDGTKYLATFVPVEHTGWILFKTIPFDEVYGYLNSLRTSIIIITLIILIVSLLVLFQISRGIYKPIGELVSELRSRHNHGEDPEQVRDEFNFLQEVFRQSAHQLSQYELEKSSNQQRQKQRLLSKWVLNSVSFTQDQFATMCREYHLSFQQDQPFLICVLKFDNFKLIADKKLEDKELIIFAVKNVALEHLNTLFIAEALDLQHDHLVFIIQSQLMTEVKEEGIRPLLHECQSFLIHRYHVSVSASLSACVSDFSHITTAYQQALYVSMYRFVAGQTSLLSPEYIAKLGQTSSVGRVAELERQLLSQAKIFNERGALEKLTALLEEVKKLEYNDMMLSLLHLVNQFKYLVYELNETRQHPIRVNAMLMSKELMEYETITLFQAKLMDVIHEVTSQETSNVAPQPVSEETTKAILLQQLIHERYADLTLSAATLASNIGVSPSRVGGLFKAYSQMSIPEFINHVRLEKALEWMENSQLTIQEIIHKVGFDNESYFYKVFKAKYGTTPREFIAKRAKERL